VEDGDSSRELGANTLELEGILTKGAAWSLFHARKKADIAWNNSRVAESLHATTRHREGSRRRVLSGGRGKLGKWWNSIGERLGGYFMR